MLQIVYKIFDLILISLDLLFDHIIYYNKFVGDFIVKWSLENFSGTETTAAKKAV